MNLDLRALRPDDEQAFLEGAKEWEGEDPGWYSFCWRPEMAFHDMLGTLERDSKGIELAPDRVAHTMLYAFVEGKIVGRLSVRHELNDRLRRRGGHIGYAVAPRYRNQGFATEIVRQGLDFCRRLGLRSIMVTCGEANTLSRKTIERFGGRLEDRVWDEVDREMIRRYWIDLYPSTRLPRST